MIATILSLMSQLTAFVLAHVAPALTILSHSEKLKTFLNERKRSHWMQAVETTRAHLQNIKSPSALYWIHVASAGELEQAIPVLRALHTKHGVSFFLTYFSPSAIPFLTNCPGVVGATSLPWENEKDYLFAINALGIKRLILVRYDFWPALMQTFRNKNLPIAIFAATLRSARSPLPATLRNSLRQRWFECSDAVFLVKESERRELESLGIEAGVLYVAGDAKWARAKERAQRVQLNQISTPIQQLKNVLIDSNSQTRRKLCVFGSPHKEELLVLQKLLTHVSRNCAFILAPHEVDPTTILKIENELSNAGAHVIKISNHQTPGWSKSFALDDRPIVVLLDTVGLLAEAYSLADIAVVGGGFDGQLHNVLEPAALSVVTLFGRLVTRAQEAETLLDKNAAMGFGTPEMLFQFLRQWGSLKHGDAAFQELLHKSAEIRDNCATLFASLPDTSEVICEVLSQKDALEVI